MKKIRKGKKMLIILLVVVVLIIAAIVIINIVNKNSTSPGGTEYEDVVIPLPETTYSEMQVKNIQMEYLRDQDKTKVSMVIDNTSTRKAENEYLDAILIDKNENILGQMQTWIENLDVGEQYKLEVVLKGDLTATTQIKLVEK